MRILPFFPLLLSILSTGCQSRQLVITSPDENLELSLQGGGDEPLTYQLRYADDTVIAPSRLGLEGGPGLSDLLLIETNVRTHEDQWSPTYGERNTIPDRYRELTALLAHRNSRQPVMEIIFRLSDEGLAYRYRLLESESVDSVAITDDRSSFSFSADHFAWVSNRAQSEISRQSISQIENVKERPLVLALHDSLYAAVGEAALVDFARMKLTADSLRPYTLRSVLAGEARVPLPYATPWRYVLVGQSPGELLEHNYFLLNLNKPNAIKNTAWIKPGKVIREVTLTTQGGLACVDFAAENGLQYVEFDAGWYGPEYDESSDARTVTVDPNRSTGPLDLQKVIDYAQTKDIGIILYVNRRALERQLDEILPLYQSWGVKGLKYGFVQVGPQEWTDWLHGAVRKAAEHQLMVDIHDEYRPTGYSRTYPNLMTQEGIRGDEESPSTAHTLTTLFTRMIAGAGDNTICYYAPRVTEKMGGHAAQMAKALLLYSPWQFVYWYDRPAASPHKKGGAGASTGIIGADPERSFFAQVPTVWDDTRVLEGAIGRFATIARKRGDNWFIGSLTAEDRTIQLTFDFLAAETSYEAEIFRDDPAGSTTTKVGINREAVKKDGTLFLELKADRGLAIIVRPAEK